MRTLALSGASFKRRSFFYCTGAAYKSLQLLALLMVEGYLGRSWGVWTEAMGFADELRSDGVLRSSAKRGSQKFAKSVLPVPCPCRRLRRNRVA